MAGCIDLIENGIIAGWAQDPYNPGLRLRVTVSWGGRELASANAATFRPDLFDAGQGDGQCAFAITIADDDWRKLLLRPQDVAIVAKDPMSGRVVPMALSAHALAFLQGDRSRQHFLLATRQCAVQLAIVCIIKNEARYVEEWVAYHLLRGVQLFVFYDNGSSDNLAETLAPYVARGLAWIVPWPNFVTDKGVRRRAWHEQNFAYAHALRTLQGVSEWVAVLDIDEFIAGRDHRHLQALLAAMPERDALTLRWRFFGSSGHDTAPPGLVIENFTFRDGQTKQAAGLPFKFIARPEAVGWLHNTHLPILAGDGALGVNAQGERFWSVNRGFEVTTDDAAWINHYHVKSRSEYRAKVARGWPENTDSKNFDWEAFFRLHDSNDVEDTSLVPFAASVRDMMHLVRTQYSRPSPVAAGRTDLALQIEVTTIGLDVVISGFAVNLAAPGESVVLLVESVAGTQLATALCDAHNAFLDSNNWGEANYGFRVKVPAQALPGGHVRLWFGATPFMRSVPPGEDDAPP